MPKTRDTGTASAHTTGQSLPLLSGHLFRVHPAHAVGALSWRGAIRGMPGTALSAQQTLRAAWPACPARGLLLDSTRVDLRQRDFAPHSPFGSVWSLWFSQLEVGVHASGIRRVGARDAAEGPARHRSPPVRSSPAPAFTAVRRSRTGSQSSGLVHLGRQQRSHAVPYAGLTASGWGCGGPGAGQAVGWTVPGTCSQVLGTRVTFQAVPSDAGLRTPPTLLPRP